MSHQGCPPPTESPASRRRRCSPSPPISHGADLTRRVPGRSSRRPESRSLPFDPVVIPSAAKSFPRCRPFVVTTGRGASSTTTDHVVVGSVSGSHPEQLGSRSSSYDRPQLNPAAPRSTAKLPALTSCALSHDGPQLTTDAPCSTAQAPALTESELGLANVVMCYQSFVLIVFAAAVVYYEKSRPVVLVSEIAGFLCLYFHLWCSHITEFWLPCSYGEDSSFIAVLCCMALFMLALLVGVNLSPVAGMLITCFATMCMLGSLLVCIREYNCSRHFLDAEKPLVSHGGEGVEESCTRVEAPLRKQVSEDIEKKKTRMFSPRSTTSAKPPWK